MEKKSNFEDTISMHFLIDTMKAFLKRILFYGNFR